MGHWILVGTGKGLVVFQDKPPNETVFSAVHFVGFNVTMVFVDETIGRWWVGVSHRHWGQKLHFSDDCGDSWKEIKVPAFHGAKLPNGKSAKLRQIWCMARSPKTKRIWMGTEPGGLFYSEDEGKSFHLVDSLWNHPSRHIEGQWFGTGSDYPFIHSIAIDPRNNNHVYVAVSSAGVFKTEDGGGNWVPKNRGLKAAYLPNPHVEIGHDPHLLLMNQKHPNVLWQQNHCGIYYSEDGAETWKDVSGPDQFPYYGFAMTIDNNHPSRSWVFPVESDENRISPQLKMQVKKTNDFGKQWIDVSQGLPTENAFGIVLRQSACKKEDIFVMGTTNGNFYRWIENQGHWQSITKDLVKINCVAID